MTALKAAPLTVQGARWRPRVRLDDGTVAVLVYWPDRHNPTRAARVLIDGARSVPVAPERIVAVIDPATRTRPVKSHKNRRVS